MFHCKRVPHISSNGVAVIVLQVVCELPFTSKPTRCLLEFSQAAANTLLYMLNAFKFLDAVLSVRVVLYASLASKYKATL